MRFVFALIFAVSSFALPAHAFGDWVGYVHTLYSIAVPSVDIDSTLSPLLTRDCLFTNIEIITGTETGTATLTVTPSVSNDSTNWTALTPTSITTATTTAIPFQATKIAAAGVSQSWKWLRLRLQLTVASGTYATTKIMVYRGCTQDPRQISNW